MRKSFKDSLKALEADIQLANTLALDYPREYDGGRLQMQLSYSPAANMFLFLVQWTDFQLAGALGLLRILIHMTYADGRSTTFVHGRKASIREFYAIIFPSLLQLQSAITEFEDRKLREILALRYSRKEELNKGKLCETDMEREKECGICLETNSKIVLPNCCHSLCFKCFQNWRERSQSCPFCRGSLERVGSGDLWIYTDDDEIVDLSIILEENSQRLFAYIEKLPLLTVRDPALACL